MVECGPMRLFIEAWADGVFQTESCKSASKRAIECLEQVASQWQNLKCPAWKIVEPPANPIVYSMWNSARAIGDPDLTPMTSVAGAIAESIADLLAKQGMSRIVVNNGGDLAIRLGPGESLAVGIRPEVDRPEVTHRVVLTPELNVKGICTSGLGGRSFTRGIASAATVFGENSAICDAAATAIANATLVQSPNIKRVLAHSVDPDTDLRGVEITSSVGELTENQIELALHQGLMRAQDLVEKALIIGACITVKGRMRCTDGILSLVAPMCKKDRPNR